MLCGGMAGCRTLRIFCYDFKGLWLSCKTGLLMIQGENRLTFKSGKINNVFFEVFQLSWSRFVYRGHSLFVNKCPFGNRRFPDGGVVRRQGWIGADKDSYRRLP